MVGGDYQQVNGCAAQGGYAGQQEENEPQSDHRAAIESRCARDSHGEENPCDVSD
jgi:hypothetical protein